VKPQIKFLVCATVGLLLVVGCYSDNFRPTGSSGGIFRLTQAGEPIQLVGGNVAAPGAPWKIPVDPTTLRGNSKSIVIQLSIGSFDTHPLRAFAFLNAGIGPLAHDPSIPDLAGEVIYIYSITVEPEFLSKFRAGLLKTKWLEQVKATARDDIVAVYGLRRSLAQNIRDISDEYQNKLEFWSGYIVALAYTVDGKNYRVVHAFTYTSGSKPDSAAFQDFSFIRMDELSGMQDRFDDFVTMLKSTHFGD